MTMKMMILNFFNQIVARWGGITVFFIVSLMVGCTHFSRGNSPAPVYKTSQTRNPYEQKTSIPAKPRVDNESEIFEQPFDPELTPIQSETGEPEIEEKRWEDNPSYSYRKRENTPPTRKRLSPAILALITDADKSSRAGDLDSAVVTLERALRIDSRNPLLTYKLARVRLQQSKSRLAESLAKKAALLSANDRALKKRAWYLISEARKQQKNFHGAKEAKLKANNI